MFFVPVQTQMLRTKDKWADEKVLCSALKKIHISKGWLCPVRGDHKINAVNLKSKVYMCLVILYLWGCTKYLGILSTLVVSRIQNLYPNFSCCRYASWFAAKAWHSTPLQTFLSKCNKWNTWLWIKKKIGKVFERTSGWPRKENCCLYQFIGNVENFTK